MNDRSTLINNLKWTGLDHNLAQRSRVKSHPCPLGEIRLIWRLPHLNQRVPIVGGRLED